jgi:hypothetical protein
MGSARRMLPKLAFLLAIAGALALGITTYTFPFIGTLDALDSGVAARFHRELGDSVRGLPGPPRQLALVSIAGAPTTARSVAGTPAGAGAEPDPAAAWVAQAWAADSVAVRAWLVRPLFFAAALQDTTVRSTFRRVSLHPGCPLISHLAIVQVRATGQVLSMSSDCPRVEEREAAKGEP